VRIAILIAKLAEALPVEIVSVARKLTRSNLIFSALNVLKSAQKLILLMKRAIFADKAAHIH